MLTSTKPNIITKNSFLLNGNEHWVIPFPGAHYFIPLLTDNINFIYKEISPVLRYGHTSVKSFAPLLP